MPARRGSRTATLAMIAGAVLLLATAPARAQDSHGAIVFGHFTKELAVAYGFARDFSSRDEAQDAAVNACLNSGRSDCPVHVWFQNSCRTLAMDQYGMAQGKGARTQDQAEARAMQTCAAAGGVGRAVVGSGCVSPDEEPDTWSGSERVFAAPEERSSGPAIDAPQVQQGLAAPEESGPIAAAPREEELTREERMQVQQGLAAVGFDAGPADGMSGRAPGQRSGSGSKRRASSTSRRWWELPPRGNLNLFLRGKSMTPSREGSYQSVMPVSAARELREAVLNVVALLKVSVPHRKSPNIYDVAR